MAKLTMTKGLPASGKSTWSNEQVLAAPPGHIVRITKDQLRAMLHSGIHSKGTESDCPGPRLTRINFLKVRSGRHSR